MVSLEKRLLRAFALLFNWVVWVFCSEVVGAPWTLGVGIGSDARFTGTVSQSVGCLLTAQSLRCAEALQSAVTHSSIRALFLVLQHHSREIIAETICFLTALRGKCIVFPMKQCSSKDCTYIVPAETNFTFNGDLLN